MPGLRAFPGRPRRRTQTCNGQKTDDNRVKNRGGKGGNRGEKRKRENGRRKAKRERKLWTEKYGQNP